MVIGYKDIVYMKRKTSTLFSKCGHNYENYTF